MPREPKAKCDWVESPFRFGCCLSMILSRPAFVRQSVKRKWRPLCWASRRRQTGIHFSGSCSKRLQRRTPIISNNRLNVRFWHETNSHRVWPDRCPDFGGMHRWDDSRRQWAAGRLQCRQRGHHACALKINFTDRASWRVGLLHFCTSQIWFR
jgi:hypothetical protein